MSGYYKPPRTELTANEKIALELTKVWGDINMDHGGEPVHHSDVLRAYTYFKNELNKEGK